MGIKGATDKIRWPILAKNLKQLEILNQLDHQILEKRFVTIEENGIKNNKTNIK